VDMNPMWAPHCRPIGLARQGTWREAKAGVF